MRILLIEDDAADAASTSELLQHGNQPTPEVIHAASYADATANS